MTIIKIYKFCQIFKKKIIVMKILPIINKVIVKNKIIVIKII